MKNYQILISQRVLDEDFKNISDFISDIHNKDAAQSYVKRILEEIKTLSYLADFIPVSPYLTLQKLHPQARRIVTKNGKWVIVFFIEDNFVKIVKIIPSKMIIH